MLFLAALCAALVPQVYTVDDNGPADFTQISAAIAAASAGDVILVEPGSYDGFTLTKELSILGSASAPFPFVYVGQVQVLGAPAFTIAGLRPGHVTVNGVAGRGQIDECWISTGITVEQCGQLVVTRTQLGHSSTTIPGVAVVNSTAEFVDCSILGGEGKFFLGFPQNADPGLAAYGASTVLLSGCNVRGGDAAYDGSSWALAGAAVLATSGSTVDIRGSSLQAIVGGLGGATGLIPACPLDTQGGAGSITWSGVTLGPPSCPGPGVTEIVPALPWLRLEGLDAPGGTKRLSLHGPAGQPALVVLATQPDLFALPGIGGGLAWLSPSSILNLLPFVTAGQDVAVTSIWTIPAAPTVAGKVILLQAVSVLPASLVLTNPTHLIVRF